MANKKEETKIILTDGQKSRVNEYHQAIVIANQRLQDYLLGIIDGKGKKELTYNLNEQLDLVPKQIPKK